MAGYWIDGEDLWKNKARILHLQLRQRFRVAVDRRLRRPIFSDDGYFSVTRWLLRFRNFRQESIASSTAFYRKRVNKDIFADYDSPIIRMLQGLAVPVVGNVCHVFMHGFNHVQVYGAEKLHQALLCRDKDKPLVTVSNHVASMDDPLVISALLPRSVLMDAHNLRWTLCAADTCFKNPVKSAFFRSVKVLPVARGDGVYQQGLDLAISKLNAGGWVHIFPEGRLSRDGGKTVGQAKRGVSRLVLDSDNMPIVIPFVHTGMQELMPFGSYRPRIGKTVTVLVGDPIEFDDLLCLEREGLASGKDIYDAISLRIGNKLRDMKEQVEKLAEEQMLQMTTTSSNEHIPSAGILIHSDWELIPMESHTVSHDRLLRSEKAEQPKEQRTVIQPGRQCKSGYAYGAETVSQNRSYTDFTEMIGFAARGLFAHSKEKLANIEDVNPLKAWKQFLEANVIWSSNLYELCIAEMQRATGQNFDDFTL